MRLRKFIHCTLSGLLLAACTSTTSSGTSETPLPPADGPVPISFGSVQTRAIVGPDNRNLSPFAVWGWYTPTAPQTGPSTEVFNNTQVQPDGTYSGTRYWMDGMTYQFYALHPHGLTATATTGQISLSGFRTQSRGADTHDLMTAISNPIAYSTASSAPPVPLTFSHELARIKFSAAAQGAEDVSLKNIIIKGFYDVADYTKTFADSQWKGEWSFTGARSGQIEQDLLVVQNTPATTGSTGQGSAESYDYVDLFDGDLMLIPQTITDDITIEATMVYPGQIMDEIYMKTTLNRVGITQWQKGMSYHYKVVLPAAMEQPVITVSVEPWDTDDIFEDLN